MKYVDRKSLPYLPVSGENQLEHISTKSSQRKGMDNDDDHYQEVDASGAVVATYHVWHHMSIHPPQRVDSGWEKLDLTGKVVASGKK